MGEFLGALWALSKHRTADTPSWELPLEMSLQDKRQTIVKTAVRICIKSWKRITQPHWFILPPPPLPHLWYHVWYVFKFSHLCLTFSLTRTWDKRRVSFLKYWVNKTKACLKRVSDYCSWPQLLLCEQWTKLFIWKVPFMSTSSQYLPKWIRFSSIGNNCTVLKMSMMDRLASRRHLFIPYLLQNSHDDTWTMPSTRNALLKRVLVLYGFGLYLGITSTFLTVNVCECSLIDLSERMCLLRLTCWTPCWSIPQQPGSGPGSSDTSPSAGGSHSGHPPNTHSLWKRTNIQRRANRSDRLD